MKTIEEKVSGQWQGSFSGKGNLIFDDKTIPFNLPKDSGGSTDELNPEQLLLGASAGCFMATLGIILDKAKIEYQNIFCESKLHMTTALPPTIFAIDLHLTVVTPVERARIEELALRAKSMCVISRALSKDIDFQLRVAVAQMFESKARNNIQENHV